MWRGECNVLYFYNFSILCLGTILRLLIGSTDCGFDNWYISLWLLDSRLDGLVLILRCEYIPLIWDDLNFIVTNIDHERLMVCVCVGLAVGVNIRDQRFRVQVFRCRSLNFMLMNSRKKRSMVGIKFFFYRERRILFNRRKKSTNPMVQGVPSKHN